MTTRTPTWVEQDYRFYRDDAAQGSNTALAALNTAATVNIGQNFRLVVNVGDTNNANSGNSTAWKLQFRIGTGSWTDVGAATAVRYATSAYVTDGTQYTTQRLGSITGSTYTNTYNEFDSNNTLTSRTWADQFCEYDFCLLAHSSGVSTGNTLTFRVVTTGNTVPTITNTATATAQTNATSKYPAFIPSISKVMDSRIGGGLSKSIGDFTKTLAGKVEVAGSLIQSVGEVTSVSVAKAEVAGTLDKTIAAVTISSAGILEDLPGIYGTLEKTIEAVTVSSGGTVEVAGTLSKTLAAVTLSSGGGVQAFATSKWPGFIPSIAAVLDYRTRAVLTKTLGAVTLASSGQVTGILQVAQSKWPAFIPAVSLRLAKVDGTVGWVNKTIAPITLSSAVEVPAWTDPPIDHWDAPEPGAFWYAWTQDTTWWPTATVNRETASGAEGSVDEPIGNVTLASAVDVVVVGTLDKTLAAVTSASAGTAVVAGTLAKTLDAVTLSSAAQASSNYVATMSKSIGYMTISAAANAEVGATLAKTIQAVTLHTQLDIWGGDHMGALDKSIGQITLATAGGPFVEGAAAQSIGEVTITGQASVLDDIVAALNQPIGAFGIDSTGQIIAVELGVRRRTKVYSSERRIGSTLVRVKERRIEGVSVE